MCRGMYDTYDITIFKLGSRAIFEVIDNSLFTIENLNVWYRQRNRIVHALKDITVKIPQRKLTVIIGKSGSGKSTFLRTLNRVVEMYHAKISGKILYKGQDIFKMNPQTLRSRVVMVLQRPIALPMSIYDNIAYPLKSIKKVKSKKEIDRKVEEALRLANLWEEVKDRLHHPATHLSGGQIQRLAIARAIALDPEVLLLDEPTAHLDPESTRYIENTILKLRERVEIVFVTHSIEQARRLAEYVIYFEEGRVIEEGPAEEVLERPRTERLRRFLNVFERDIEEEAEVIV